MSGDCNVYGGFVVGQSSSGAKWGEIKGTISSQLDLLSALNDKVDKVKNKGLSSNDYTDSDKDKLSRVNAVYSVLVGTNWNEFVDGVYVQNIDINGIRATDSVVADIVLDTDPLVAEAEMEAWNCVSRIIINDGSVTIHCYNSTPKIKFTMRLKI